MAPLAPIAHVLHDKTAWPDGPWRHEPDKALWLDPATGYACLAMRNYRAPLRADDPVDDLAAFGTGAWAGYVALPRAHPLSGARVGDPRLAALEVHGGITYADVDDGASDEDPAWLGLERPYPRGLWLLGFDCGHLCDAAPLARGRPRRAYRDLAFVTDAAARLAAQLAALSSSSNLEASP